MSEDIWNPAHAQNLRLKAERLSNSAEELLEAAEEIEDKVEAHVRSTDSLKFMQGHYYEAVKTALSHFEEVSRTFDALYANMKEAVETLRETEFQLDDH